MTTSLVHAHAALERERASLVDRYVDRDRLLQRQIALDSEFG